MTLTAKKQLTIGIDIGATKIAAGLVVGRGRLTGALTLPTLVEKGQEAGIAQVLRLTERLIRTAGGAKNLLGIGICAPGPLNPITGVIINPPNLKWRDVPLARMISERYGLPCSVENDANAAGLAEALIGAAAGYRHVFYVTISTGVGTGIIIDRKIYHGSNGTAGEGGHVQIDYQSPWPCNCGSNGCIEALACGPAIVRRTRVMLEQKFKTPSLLRTMTRGDLRKITPSMVAAAAGRGDSIAGAIIDETGYYLGVWLRGMVALLDPEAIVIGGGVAQIGKPLFDRIRETLPGYTVSREQVAALPILPAKLKKNVGIYGAASLFLPLL